MSGQIRRSGGLCAEDSRIGTMNEFVDIKKAAQLLGKTERRICQMCVDGALKGAKKKGSRWQVPVSADAKLALYQSGTGLAGLEEQGNLTNSKELLDIPENKRQDALRKVGLIQGFEKFSAAYVRNGGNRSDAVGVFASQHQISERSLARWLAKYRVEGLLGLVDTRGGGKFISQRISSDAFELFKAMYLTPQQLSVKICWHNVRYINQSENRDWKIPSLQFMYRYVKKQVPLFVEILHREGLAAYEAKCAPYIEIDPDSVQPGQVFVGDHHQFNCWIRHRNKWIRPWITAWQDMRSRDVVGWIICPSPNQTTILLAMKRAIEKYGPPDSVKIDNGRDYDSEMWTGTTKAKRRALTAGYIDEQMVAGIYAMMDIGVSFSIKYHPQSKPIERFFDTVDCQFTKTFATYCGKDSNRKPEHLNDLLKNEKAISEAHDLESFAEIAGQYISTYNNAAHTGRGMDGKSPADVIATRQSRRVMAEGVLDLLLRVWSRELVVGKNGVNYNKMWYGQFNMDLAVHQGKRVRIAYDPDDLRQVYVYDATTLKLITIAEQNQLVRYGSPVSEEHLRFATRQKSKAVSAARQFRDSRLTANMDLTTLTIKAMQDGQKTEDRIQKTEVRSQKTLRPVKTPMDGQVHEHKRCEVLKAVRKAAGAESIEAVLDFDFSVLKPKQQKVNLELFNER